MTEDQRQAERLKEFAEYQSKLTRFKTKEEFKVFAKQNHVFYKRGFGGMIEALVRTDEEFIDFMLKCCSYHHEDYYPWFLNDYNHSNEDNHIFFKQEPADDSDDESWYDEEGCFLGSIPSVPIVAYSADYNQFYDDPFEVHRVDEYMTYPPDTFRVNPKTSALFPAIVRFVSMDTFDRMGSIKCDDLTIISLADLEDGLMMFR